MIISRSAIGAGCAWLQIDRDAETIRELPAFDW
ncbi:DUF5983 family protein [Pradoshia sp.]